MKILNTIGFMDMKVNGVNWATNLKWKIHPLVYWEFQYSWRKAVT